MAVIALATQQCTQLGITPTRTGSLVATTNSYTFPNDGRTFLHFLKTGAGDATVTIVTTGTADGLAIDNVDVVVPALTGDVMVGPFKPLYYNPSQELISFSMDDSAGLSVAIVHLS